MFKFKLKVFNFRVALKVHVRGAVRVGVKVEVRATFTVRVRV